MKKVKTSKRGVLSMLCLGLFFALGFIGAETVSAATVTVGQTSSKASSTYFYYNPSGTNAYSVINSAINAAASGATASNPGVVNIENAAEPYEVSSHILAKSYVNIIGQSRGGVVIKIASGLTPTAYGGPGTTGWGGTDSSAGDGGIINVWSGVTNVKIANMTLDGSCGDYYACTANDRGHSEFNLMNVYRAPNVTVDNVKFTNGKNDGIRATGDNMEVSNSVFDMIGHDAVQGYGIKNLKFHNNVVAMRTNSGVRCSGDGDGCYVYNNEFYTGSGGGSALELQGGFTNVKVYNNYFHDISGAGGNYGAIGYPGQSPSGSGHEYYYNLFVNMPYAIDHVPSSASSHHNIMINCSTTVGGGSDSNNIKTASGYVFAKYGTNKAGDTYWTVTSGSLASAFSGIKVGITSDAGGNGDGGTVTPPAPGEYTVTVNGGTGSGNYAPGETVSIAATGSGFTGWSGDTSALSCALCPTPVLTMPSQNITITANYGDGSTDISHDHDLIVTNGTGDGSYPCGSTVTITADPAPAGKVFDKWTGDTCAIASTYTPSDISATINVSQDTTLVATYKDAPTASYVLTITNGTGDGSYAAGTQVTITADPAPAGKVFDKWTGIISAVASTSSITTTVTMPASNTTITATYKTASTTNYTLTVTNGTGDGSYLAGTQVTITANAPATGKIFDKWTGATASLASATSATTTVTMPSASTTVTATYKDAGTTKYTLTVTNGSGDGSYLAGTKITITADPAPAGKVFDKWTGTTSCVSSITSATTTVTMPAASTTVIAAYKTVSTTKYTLTVTNGTGDGSYVAGTQTTITADPAPAGKMFDKWIGCDSCLASITSATTKATMTASNLTLTATYKDIVASELPDGTLIKLPDSPKVYIIENGEKKWIPTPEVFEQMGGDWNEIITATQSILDAIADLEDNLIRMIDDFKVFLVTDGVKRHIPNPEVFLDYGFDWGDVKEVNEETVTQYEDTYLIRETGTEPVYYLNPEGVRKWIPTEEIFNSYQDKWEDVQIVSKTEMESYPVSNLIREEGSNDIYLTENNIKKYIPSPTVFNKYGLDWNSVTTVNQTEFNWYKSGGELR